MKARPLALLGMCLLAGCGRDEPPASDAVEVLGEAATTGTEGAWFFRAFRYQKGDRLALVGFAQWPANLRPTGPAFVVLYRLPNPTRAAVTGKTGKDLAGARIHLEQRVAAAGGSTSVLRYQLKNEPLEELWSIDGQGFSGDAGRVALVDLTKSPAEVKQVQVDLANLIPGDPNPITMKAALNKLLERSEEVRTFLGQAP